MLRLSVSLEDFPDRVQNWTYCGIYQGEDQQIEDFGGDEIGTGYARLVHPGFSPRAPWQQLISARLPPYIEMGYRVRQMRTFGRYSSILARGVRGQRLGLSFCIGSIGACPENRILSLLIQDGRR